MYRCGVASIFFAGIRFAEIGASKRLRWWFRPSCIRSSEALRAAGLEAEKRGDVHVDGRRQGQASRGTSETNFKRVNVKLSNVSTLFQTTNDNLSVLTNF